VAVGRHVVHLGADRRRWLAATDADGRDLIVSCGTALHHLRVALAAAGVRTTDRRPFGDWPIPEDSWRQLEGAAVGQGAILRAANDGRPRVALLDAIRKAAAQQHDMPG
jgi:hypothetical protein